MHGELNGLCPGPMPRRSFLQIGGAATGSLGLSSLLKARDLSPSAGKNLEGTAVIFVWLPEGVPRARTLKKDLEQVGIPFCDEQGRYADFHSLRYSWATHLQRQGVNSRMAMELMRHSDRKLTDRLYTDVNLLPLGETVRNLPDEEPLIHILTHICGKTCRNGSRVVANDQSSETTETSVTVGDRRELSPSDEGMKMVDAAVANT